MILNKKMRAHPILILSNLRLVFIFGLIPILRGVLYSLDGDFSIWTVGFFMDFLLLLGVVVYAIVKWYRCVYLFNEESIQQKEGVFFSRETRLDWKHISVLKVRQPFYLRPFGASIFQADTVGGSYKNADIHLCLSKKETDDLLVFYEKKRNISPVEASFVPQTRSVFLLALVSTNNFIGIFYIFTFISQTGKLLGREFSEMLLGSFESFARAISDNVPPAALTLAYLLLFAWFIGVLFTLMQYYHYKVEYRKNTLTVSGGLFARQSQMLDQRQINYLSIQRNVVAYCLGLHALYISSVGCGKEKSDITCVLPSTRKEKLNRQMTQLFPKYCQSPPLLHPSRGGFMRFFAIPLLCCLVTLLFMGVGIYLLPHWSSFILFVGMMILVPCLAFLLTRMIDFNTSGINLVDDQITLSYSTGFTLHTVLIPREKIVKIYLQQSWIQMISGNCTIHLFTLAEQKKKHKCRNINRNKAMELLGVASVGAGSIASFRKNHAQFDPAIHHRH